MRVVLFGIIFLPPLMLVIGGRKKTESEVMIRTPNLNEYATAEHALKYLARADGIPHRAGVMQGSPSVNNVGRLKTFNAILFQDGTLHYAPVLGRPNSGAQTSGAFDRKRIHVDAHNALRAQSISSERKEATSTAYVEEVKILQIFPLEELDQRRGGNLLPFGIQVALHVVLPVSPEAERDLF